MGKTIIKRSRDTSTQLTRDLTCRRFETRHRNPSVTQLVGSIGAAWPNSSSGDLTWAGRFADLELEEQKRGLRAAASHALDQGVDRGLDHAMVHL